MTCQDTTCLLNSYVDEELDSTGRLSVETHLRACSSCSIDVENLHGLAAAIRNGSLRFNAPARLKRDVRAAIRAANSEAKGSNAPSC
jgi:anti-sigma factor RsiW